MTIKYLKKAEKTPQTGSDETRNIVQICWQKLRQAAKKWRLPMVGILMAIPAV